MRFKVYISVGGEKFDAESFRSKVSTSGARVRVIGHRGAETYPDLVERMNVWETPAAEGSNHPGNDIKALLKQYAAPLSLLTKEEQSWARCWVTIVGYFAEGEQPRGFSFDSETVSLLSQFRAGIEIDMVRDLSD